MEKDTITDDMVRNQVADQARFTVFALVEQIFSQQNKKALRSLRLLREYGEEPVFIIAMIVREAQQIYALVDNPARKSAKDLLKGVPLWPSRVKDLEKYGNAIPPKQWPKIFSLLTLADRQSKGYEAGSVWCTLERVVSNVY